MEAGGRFFQEKTGETAICQCIEKEKDGRETVLLGYAGAS
jgi:hypothetical protein